MSQTGLSPQQFESIPPLRGLSREQLGLVTALFQPVETKAGEELFCTGQPADALYLLEAGEVTLFQADQETHRLHPPVVFGELGALVPGATRNVRAVIGDGVKLWKIPSETLLAFFSEHPDIALRVQQSLMRTNADKIRRDQRRLSDMRQNLIRTQKAMKRMRDFLLESQDTVVSKPIHEILEGLIQQNRRVNYRVTPPAALAATWRWDDKTEMPLVEISRTHVSFRLDGSDLPAAADRVSGVLSLSGPEIPVSGKVLRTIDRRVDVVLDLLMDEYIATLEGYLTRVQMLDFLV